MRRIRRPSPSMLVACLALGVALSGTAVAASVALAPNSVGTVQLKTNAVTAAKVKNGTLLKADFKAGQVPAGAAGPAGSAGPAGPTGPTGPSDAYARFLNGPIAIPAVVTTLTSLTIPQAGKYVIWSKAIISSTASGVATCQLVAGGDLDQSQSWASTVQSTLSNIVVHDFTTAGSAEFKCGGTTTTTLQALFVKIAAIRVGNLTNTG